MTQMGLQPFFEPLSTLKIMSVNACDFKVHLGLNFIYEGFRMGEERKTLYQGFPGVCSMLGLKLARRWAQPPCLLMQRNRGVLAGMWVTRSRSFLQCLQGN